MKRCNFTYLGCLIVLFFSSWACQPPAEKKPNIIYVLADDLGYGDIGAYNPQCQFPTPYLDQMAAEGMIFTDAHTSSSVCTPTRYGILTGRYNWRSVIKSGVLYGEDSAIIQDHTMTVPKVLKHGGYHTAFIGKWHLGWNWARDVDGEIDFAKPISQGPQSVGFDYSYGHIASLDMEPYVYVENGRATAIPTGHIEAEKSYKFYRAGRIASDFKIPEVTPHFFDKANEYITERSKEGQPFFLYLPLPSPHTPILPTEEWQGKSQINPYADFVMMIDDYMGRLFDTLDRLGIAEETMVVFTSDNGCSPMANFEVLKEKNHYPSYVYRGHKADIYEGGHRVPFIVKWPSVIKGGQTSDQLLCTTDFLATCAEVVDYPLKESEGVDSYSMMPLFQSTGDATFQRKSAVHSSINGSFALREGDWKLITAPGSGGWSFPRPNAPGIDTLPIVQLYNLSEDQSEQINLWNEESEKVNELLASLIKIVDRGRSTEGPDQENDANRFDTVWTQKEDLYNLQSTLREVQ